MVYWLGNSAYKKILKICSTSYVNLDRSSGFGNPRLKA